MSHPLALVRAEIKTWERDFASRYGRDPSLQDIRDHPPIAEKYKLYKKLSKAPTNPSTPPRTHCRLPVPKSRPVESISPLPRFNPFSPVKKTAIHNDTLPRTSVHPNPFPTPAKNNSSTYLRTETPSPDPFPSVLPSHQSSSHGHLVSTTAISRARKRLRGEPVSPSPNKLKRQRIHPRAPPPIPKSEQDSSNSEHEPDRDHELPQCQFTSSFVADSPVKAPAGGKSFKLLFDDALPLLSVAKMSVDSSLARLGSSSDTSIPQRTSVDRFVPTSLKFHHDLKSKGVSSVPEHRASSIQGKIPSQIFPTKDLPALSHKPTFGTVVSEVYQPRASIKRPHGDDLVCQHTELDIQLQPQYPLVPPSPPPQDVIDRGAGKGKARPINRKKPRVESEENDEGMVSSDDISFKITTVSLDRGEHSNRQTDEFDWDPLLQFGTRNHEPAAEEQIDANHHALGTFSVDLPDEFRRVLAVSPSRRQNVTEERVVRGLLYGDRVGHYDPSRGGDIWDAGETDEGAQGDVETEDEWEGEPVPWEVGEL